MFTVMGTFAAVAAGAARLPFLCVPPAPARAYAPDGLELTYGEMLRAVLHVQEGYRAAGYGHGHRALLILENRPDFLVHFLALNGLGTSIVPVNPDARESEIRHLAELSAVDVAVGLDHHLPVLRAVSAAAARFPVVAAERWDGSPPSPTRAPRPGVPGADTEAAMLATSGTTGTPKGCVLSNRYMVMTAQWYASPGGIGDFGYGRSRLMNPLPFYHMGGLCMTTLGMMMSANCVIVPERFSPRRFMADAVACRADAMHYLGVVPAMLLAQPPGPTDRTHGIRFALGAGATPALIERFEERFAIPCREGWAMTETGRALWDTRGPRHPGLAAVGRPRDGLEVMVADEDDNPLPHGGVGELRVRWGGPEGPRWGFFSGYHGNPEATEEMWRGGWLRTGDSVTQLADGTIVFIDRKKNIIRRSGENIAAAEVELTLSAHPDVVQSAAIAVPDEIRQEEVLACIVLRDGVPATSETARALFGFVNTRLAYYKAPGWVVFLPDLPTTGTQKVARSRIFPPGEDVLARPDAIDLRSLKQPNRKGTQAARIVSGGHA